jgi:hypothetical protein
MLQYHIKETTNIDPFKPKVTKLTYIKKQHLILMVSQYILHLQYH